MAHTAAVELRLRDALVRGASAWLVGLGVLVLGGWALGSPRLVAVLPGLPPMWPPAAAGFVLAGVALWLRTPVPAGTRPRSGRRGAGTAAALALAALGALVLAEYGLGQGLGIDVAPSVGGWEAGPWPGPTPGRPSAHTALVLLCAGLTLALLDVDRRGGHRPATVLAILTTTVALVAVLGHLYGIPYLRGSGSGSGTPVHGAVSFLVLAGGILLSRPDRPLVRAFTSPGPGGVLYRRLAPALVVVPFLIGLWQSAGARGALPAGGWAVAAITIGTMALLLVVIARTVRRMDRADVVQRRLTDRLREERDFTSLLLQALPDGVVVTDLEHRVLDVNPSWCALTGWSRADLLGATPPYPWRGPVEAVPDDVELVCRRADGSELPVLVSRTPVPGPDGRPRAYLSTYKDMTERRRSTAALAAYTGELERANEDLGAANQFKTDLMGMLSHEIGQPLTSITTFAGLLSSQWDQLTDAQRLEDVAKIESGARRLFELVGELMLMFRLDAQTILAGRVPVDVAAAVRQATADVAVPVEVRLPAGPGPVAAVDPGHLQQILGNLLSNAVKYGSPPLQVSVARVGDRVQVVVRDHGEGVPEAFVPQLFERFSRAATGAATTAEGNGLGLFIVRQLAEASGGTIFYRAAEPGSCFVVDLEPADEPALVTEEGLPFGRPAS